MSFIQQLKQFEDPSIQKNGPTITVSGLSGSGKTTFAKILAKELGLRYVSAGQIQRDAAKKEGISLTEFSERIAQTNGEFDLRIDRQMLNYAQNGGFMIDGRISGFVAGNYADLRFYIYVTDPEIVAERIFSRDGAGVSKEETLRLISRRDKADKTRIKKLYGIFTDDTSIYELENQIDNTNLTKDEFIKKIVEIADVLKKTLDL